MSKQAIKPRRIRKDGKRAARSGFTSVTLSYGHIVPDRMTVPMKYSEIVTIGGTGNASYVYSVNSPYDPNVTSTGGSVRGFTALSTLYNRYRVNKSHFRITIQSPDDAGIFAVALSGSQGNPGTAVSAADVAMYSFAKPACIKITSSEGQGPALVLEDTITMARLLGNGLYDEINLYGLGAADPGQQAYWVVGTSSLTGFGVYNLVAVVEIEYEVEWSSPTTAPA